MELNYSRNVLQKILPGMYLCTVDGVVYSSYSLTKDLLSEGRLIITDNYYTSFDLAKYSHSRNTNLIGTITKHWKGLDKKIIEKILFQAHSRSMLHL